MIGSPGTGKTFFARAVAFYVCNEKLKIDYEKYDKYYFNKAIKTVDIRYFKDIFILYSVP